MQKLKVDFRNSWGGFMKEDNLIINTLRMKYDVEVNEQDADVAIIQNTGDGNAEKQNGNCQKTVHWFVEALNRTGVPNYDNCDYSFTSCNFEDERNIRIPLWQFYVDWFDNSYVAGRNPAFLVPTNLLTAERSPQNKDKFCCVLTNNGLGLRQEIYPRAFQYWTEKGFEIESRGNFLRTHPSIGGDEMTKQNYIQDFKFNLCFDNSDYTGWITEKVIHPLIEGVVPIYWGCADVGNDFNTKSLIHARDFSNDVELYDYVIEVANDEKKLGEIQSEPIFVDNKIPDHVKPETLLAKIESIIL